jgi:hypothetical protein
MKYTCCILLFFFVLCNSLQAQSLQYLEVGRVIVKLKPDAVYGFETRLRQLNKTSSDTSILVTGLKSFDAINRRRRATNMRRVFPDAGEFEDKHRKYGLHLWYEIFINDGENPETVANEYNRDENVQIAEPQHKIKRNAVISSPLPFDEIPDDPKFNLQWNYNNTGQTGGTPGADIRLPEAWEKIKSIGIKNKNVIVAVIDGGVNHEHEDLNANMWVNSETDEKYGYNFVGNSSTIVPEDHATHVAGIIAAVTGNGKGVAGIAGKQEDGYGIKIMNVQIFEGDKYVSSIGKAFTYAADRGAVIAQNSWGYEDVNYYQKSDIDAIKYFIEQAGMDKDGNPRPDTPMAGGIVIFAAGNDASDGKWYPAYFDNVIAVAATNHYGKLAYYSNFGNWVDIAAPGGDAKETGKNKTGGIYSTSYSSRNRNYYEYMQGTSMACPHVSGVAALILSVYGNESFTPDMLRSRLLCSATPLTDFDPANASKMGAGLVNASTAIHPDGPLFNQITDLTAEPVNAVSCRLKWTVPQSENNYEPETVYYSAAFATEEITDDNFDKYAQIPVAIAYEAGETANITVNGLNPNTLYYLAIRNSDYQCQVSAISNIAAITTRNNEKPEVSGPLDDILMRDVSEEKAYFAGGVFTDPDGNYAVFRHFVVRFLCRIHNRFKPRLAQTAD